MNNFDIQVERNLKGKQLESIGDYEAAIELYELNIGENFEGSYPYRRLSILYRKRKMYQDEIRVLQKAISVFKNLRGTDRVDIEPKLEEFRVRLDKARRKADKVQ